MDDQPRMAFPLIDVTADTVAQTGFFCLQSRRKSEGYRRKLHWLEARFAEGMRLKMLGGEGRGFVEYLPGEHAWRAVEAAGYMVIHCIWVVGRCKGNGGGRQLLEACIADAREAGMNGVAMVTSEQTWLVGADFLLAHGFEAVDTAPPAFTLLVKRFGNAPPPRFSGGWADKAARFGSGLTVVRTDQCPYIEDATNVLLDCAAERGMERRTVELTGAGEIRRTAPSAFGVFNVVLDGELLSYHWLTKKDFAKRVDALAG